MFIFFYMHVKKLFIVKQKPSRPVLTLGEGKSLQTPAAVLWQFYVVLRLSHLRMKWPLVPWHEVNIIVLSSGKSNEEEEKEKIRDAPDYARIIKL